jgi:hypothetical protein
MSSVIRKRGAYEGQHRIRYVEVLTKIVSTALYAPGHTKVGPRTVVIAQFD